MTSAIGRWLDALMGRTGPEAEPAPEPAGPLPPAAVPPEPVDGIREQLKWFNRFDGPPEELVRWFAAPPAPVRGEDPPQVLNVAAAIERRKWVLRGAAENPEDQHFQGRSNWLPLIAYRGCLLIYESGPMRSGLVVRQPDKRERYVKDRTRPMPLATFDLARFARGEVDEEEEDAGGEEPADESLLDQLIPLVGVRLREGGWSPRERLPFFKDGPPGELVDWFDAHDGQLPDELWFPEERVHAKWKALSLDEALVARDQLLEQANPALADRLQRDPRWLPLFTVNGEHLLVFSEARGVALHAKAGQCAPVPWSRWSTLDAFLHATHEIWAPQFVGTYAGNAAYAMPEEIVGELQTVTGEIEERMVQREGLSVDDAELLRGLGLSEELALGLPAWFEPNVARPGPPLVGEGEHALSGSEAMALRKERSVGRPWIPLVRGSDGVLTAWVEKAGVVELWPDGALVPVNATFSGWLEGLLWAADAEREARVEPGSIRRAPTGVWTVDVAPLIAKDVIAALHALPWSFTRSGCTLTLERGAELDVRAEAHTRLVLQLPDALVDQMIADLDALDGFEAVPLHWEDLHDLVLVVRGRS